MCLIFWFFIFNRVRRSLGKDVNMGEKKTVVRSSGSNGSSKRMVVDRRVTNKVVVKKGPNAPNDRRIKIRNIPFELTWKDIKTALSDVGKIERCDVENGEATITFASAKEAARAVQNYDGGDMNGRKIRVTIF